MDEDSSKLKSPSPRRVLEMFKFGKKTKKETVSEPDIEHPFEQNADHFSLLEQADQQQAAQKPVVKEDAATANRKRHGFILAELIQTEKDYVDDLEMIVELFLVPLRANKLVSKEEADGVFGNLPHLIPLNRQLLDKVKVCCVSFGRNVFLCMWLSGLTGAICASDREAGSGWSVQKLLFVGRNQRICQICSSVTAQWSNAVTAFQIQLQLEQVSQRNLSRSQASRFEARHVSDQTDSANLSISSVVGRVAARNSG